MAMTMKTLTDELKQTRPFASLAAEAPVAIMRTAHLLRRRLEAVVAEEGITLQQYNVLRILRGARGPLPTMEISERMIEPSCGITRLITTLEEKKLIRREQWPGDRRQFLCQITAAGLKVLDIVEAPLDEIESSVAEGLSQEQLRTLLDALTVIRTRTASPET